MSIKCTKMKPEACVTCKFDITKENFKFTRFAENYLSTRKFVAPRDSPMAVFSVLIIFSMF